MTNRLTHVRTVGFEVSQGQHWNVENYPRKGHYHISDKPGRNTVHINLPLFEGCVQDHVAMANTGIEMGTFDPDDKFRPYRPVFTGLPAEWLGSIGPGADHIEPEDLGDWRLRYRIERA